MSKLPRTFRHVSTRGQQPVHGMARRPAPSRARDYDRFSSGADPRKSKVRDSLPHYEEPRVQKVLMNWRCRGETRRSWWMTSRLCSDMVAAFDSTMSEWLNQSVVPTGMSRYATK